MEQLVFFSENYLPIDVMLVFFHSSLFVQGIMNTVVLVALSLLIGGFISVFLGLLRYYKVFILSQLVWLFIYIERGSPLLVQLYLIYYGSGQFEAVRESYFWSILSDPWYCALLAFSLNTAAYTAEIVRGGIQSVPRGEIEAARSFGMSMYQQLTRIILPRAFRYSLPAYSNEVIFMIHGSAVMSTITIIDILGAGRTLNSKYYIVYEGFLTAAFLYMIIVFLVDFGFKKWEYNWLSFLSR